MKAIGWRLFTILILASGFVLPAEAQINYTQVNVSIPVGGSYSVDLDGDGVIDFTLRSKLIQGYCQSGDEYVWSLSVIPADGNEVETASNQAGADYASALLYGAVVNAGQNFFPDQTILGELYWGTCGIGTMGEWLNLPNRYLGLQFRASDGSIHYAWLKVSTVAYIDQNEHLQATTLLSGFAYQTNAGLGIAAGAM